MMFTGPEPAHVQTPELRTPRLWLRPPVESDAEAVIRIAGDWEVARHLSRVPHPYSSADFRFFMDHVVTIELTWALVTLDTDQLVGLIGLVPAPQDGSAELGYYLARSHWGRGLATEAGLAVVQWVIQHRSFTKLTSGYHCDNPASSRVLTKLGFTPVGEAMRACLATGMDKLSVNVEWLPPTDIQSSPSE